jgi:hypothetical protein
VKYLVTTLHTIQLRLDNPIGNAEIASHPQFLPGYGCCSSMLAPESRPYAYSDRNVPYFDFGKVPITRPPTFSGTLAHNFHAAQRSGTFKEILALLSITEP